MNVKDNIMYFDSDDEFYQFVVVPEIKNVEYVNVDGNPSYYMDFDFSEPYKNAIAQNKTFIIKDENSQIYKHGAVSYRTITKPVSNIEEYFKI